MDGWVDDVVDDDVQFTCVCLCVCKTYCTTVSCSFLSSKTYYDYEEPHKIGLNGSTRPVTARVLVGERERGEASARGRAGL